MDRKEIKKEAEKLYKKGRTLKEISDKLEVPQGTIRRWKSEGGWGGERSEKNERTPNKKSERSPGKNERSPGQQEQQKDAQEVETVLVDKNSELSEKQQLFCIYFVKSFNATKAYQKAYNCSYASAAANASRLMEKDGIKKEIGKLKNVRINKEMLTPEDIFQKYIDIAFADITDFVEIDYKTQDVYVKKQEEIDGTLLTGIKRGKSGIEIKLPDRAKALEWLANHMDIATEEQKARIAVLKKQAWQDTEEDETGIVEIAQVLENENDMDTTAETD